MRTALALSTLTGKPFRIDKIRHQRSRPGLKPQHLSCIDALKRLANAQVEGALPGSAAVEYLPGKISAGTVGVDIGTAGSITLLLQSLLLPCMFADARVILKIKGGTDTKWSIPIDYFSCVILPFFNQLASIEIKSMQRKHETTTRISSPTSTSHCRKRVCLPALGGSGAHGTRPRCSEKGEEG